MHRPININNIIINLSVEQNYFEYIIFNITILEIFDYISRLLK